MTFGLRTMNAKRWRLGSLLILLLGAVGCSGFSRVSQILLMMTPDQEVQFGAKVAEEVQSHQQLVADEIVVQYVRDVGNRVVRNSPRCEVPIHFYVVQDDSINAFAIPGGNIYINTGLLKAADDEAELAAVMAHEVGHAVRRHSARQISNNMSVDLLHKVILPGNSPEAFQIIENLFKQGVMTTFSRKDEFEADSLAVRTLHDAGYDPVAMSRLLGKLKQQVASAPPGSARIIGPFTKYISTHPPTQERIANVDQIARSLPPKTYDLPTTDLRRMQGRLKQLNLIK